MTRARHDAAMPRPPFLANVIAVTFLVAAAALIGLRWNNVLWAVLAATAVTGAVAAEAIGLVIGRRRQLQRG